MSFRPLDLSPAGILTLHDYDESSDTEVIRTLQDVEPLLDMNKEMQNCSHERWRMTDIPGECGMWLGARVPVTVIYEWKRKLGVDLYNKHHWPEVRKLLNSSEYSYLKCTPLQL